MLSRLLGSGAIAAAGSAQAFEAGVVATAPTHFWRFGSPTGTYENLGSSSVKAMAGASHTKGVSVTAFGIGGQRGLQCDTNGAEPVTLEGDAVILPETSDFTLWLLILIGPTENDANINQNPIVAQRLDTPNRFWFEYQPSVNRFRIDWDDGGVDVTSANFLPALSLASAESVFLTRDGTNLKVFRAGEHATAIQTIAHGGAVIEAQPTTFLNRAAATNQAVHSTLCEVALWNSVLSESAMDDLYALTGLS